MAGEALLLDLDGTIWDSAPWYAARLSTNPAERADLAIQLKKSGTTVSAAKLLRAAGYTTTRIRAECRTYGPPEFYPGALSTLQRYVQSDRTVAIVTNLPAWLVTPLVEGSELENLVGHFETGKRGVPAKPRPNLLLRALAALQVAPTAATMLGDTGADLKAASAAGTCFIWASWGYGGIPPEGTATAESWEELQL